MALIHEKMIAVMGKVTAIEKGQENTMQKFFFRGIDDIMNELHSVFADEGIFLMPSVLEHSMSEKATKSGGFINHSIIKMQYSFYAADGSNIICIAPGEAMDSGDKSTSKAMSIALKYALLQSLLIPTKDEKDPDASTPPELKPQKGVSTSKPNATASTPKQATPETTEKVWLNPGTDLWGKALDYVKQGHDLKEIRKKYNISVKNGELLIQQSKS